MSIIEIKNVFFSYEKGKEILKNINIKIEKGSFIGLLGSNGCGKTTLIQIFNGLLHPDKGQVLLNGIDIKKLKDREIFSEVGLVFQNPDDQLFSFTVYEDVAYGVVNLGIKGDELKKRVEDALKLMDIYELKNNEIHKLSFGQKKRVAIAGVLAMKPQVIALDEPTAGLDPMTSVSLMKSLKRIQENEQVTIIIATHEVDIVPLNCNYVYVLNQGRVLLEGMPEEVFENKKVLRECNLRLPRIGHLIEILNEKDNLPITASTMTISGARKAIKEFVSKLKNNDKES
jgi:cobalt/nickel transport system ATP-binding protein